MVFQNKKPRRISGPNRDKETGYWRKQHNEHEILATYYDDHI
jgi:hypothetical protein